MPWDKIDVRINGQNQPINTAGWVELKQLSIGYYGISSCQISDMARRHESNALVYPNGLVELSRDGFITTFWKGRVSRFIPGGVATEGMAWEVVPLNELMKRRTCRWNKKPSHEYNQSFQTDLTSPSFDGTLSNLHRWTLGQMLIDVLEHAFGIATPSRMSVNGGSADMPILSAIPLHHPSPLSVTNPYMAEVIAGPARDYLDQLVWDPELIMNLLDVRVPDVRFQDLDLWTVIEQIVQHGGEHGVFIDPTVITKPQLVVHKFSNSTTVQVNIGQDGYHAETAGIRARDDKWEYSDEHVANLIVIQGADQIGKTDPNLGEEDPLSGKLDRLDAAGKFWRVRNQDVAPFIVGYDATDPRNLTLAEQTDKVRPRLWKDGQLHTDQIAGWIPSAGILFLKTAMGGDLRVEALFRKPFLVTVGPEAGQCADRPPSGPGSTPRYPTPSAFDAFNEVGLVKEMHISADQYTDGKRNIEQEMQATLTLPPTTNLPRGKMINQSVQGRQLEKWGYDPFFDSVIDRDDTGFMIEYAEELQRRFRDISIKLNLTLDGLTLDGLWDTQSQNIGLRKRISLLGLEGNRWSDAQLQIMSITVNPAQNEMVIECSSTIYNVTKLFPGVWRRRHHEKKVDNALAAIEALKVGDTVADQNDGAPDGEPSLKGVRQQLHQSPAPRYVRYPGFRVHIVQITETPATGLGVYHGTRVDEAYHDDEDFDKIVKFFNVAESEGGEVLLKEGDVVHVYPVQSDSLGIFLQHLNGLDDKEVAQDEAHVCITAGPGSTTFKAVLFDKQSFKIDWEADPIFRGRCPGPLFDFYRGEYSFFEVVPDTRFEHLGYWKIKQHGRFGIAGQCDAAREFNRSNTNIHIGLMVVEMHIGVSHRPLCESSMDVSSSEVYLDSSAEVESTQLSYWFNLNLPREDCLTPYVVSSHPGNDFPPVDEV